MRPQIHLLYPKPRIAMLSLPLLIQISPTSPTSMPCVCMLPSNHSVASIRAPFRFRQQAGFIIKINLREIKQLSLLAPYNNKRRKDTLPGTGIWGIDASIHSCSNKARAIKKACLSTRLEFCFVFPAFDELPLNSFCETHVSSAQRHYRQP